MSAKVIWIHVGLVALFAGGVAAGVLYHRHIHDRVPPPGSHSSHGHDSTPYVEHFRERLDLTDEQTAKTKDVLDRLHREMMALTKDFHDRFQALRSQAWSDIRATLSESQRSEFEKLVEDLEKNRMPH